MPSERREKAWVRPDVDEGDEEVGDGSKLLL